jgi:hypothetical protein
MTPEEDDPIEELDEKVVEDTIIRGQPLSKLRARAAAMRVARKKRDDSLRAKGERLMPRFANKNARSSYMRRSLIRFLGMSPAELEALTAETNLQDITKSLVGAHKKTPREAAHIVSVWKEIKETLGERIGSNWKDTMESKEDRPDIINDLPQSFTKYLEN